MKGYKTFWIGGKKFRVQLYYPEFYIKSGELYFHMSACLRLVWRYGYKAFAVEAIFGFGVDYSVPKPKEA